MRLRNRIAIITGATSGIGRAASIVFAQEGAKILATGRREDEGEQTVRRVIEAGGEAVFFQADVTSDEDVIRMKDACLDNFGTIDILFNNAGINPIEARTDLSVCPEHAWDRVIEVNVKSIYRCTRVVVPIMIQNHRGAIVNTSSTFGLVGFANRAVYVASKGAVTQLTKAMALDYGPHNIRVNCICPGMTLNRRVRDLMNKAAKEGRLSEILEPYALGRLGTTKEVAQAAAFLCSDDASWITGAALAVDGGYTAR